MISLTGLMFLMFSITWGEFHKKLVRLRANLANAWQDSHEYSPKKVRRLFVVLF